MRRIFWTITCIVLSFCFLVAAFPPPYDFTSSQDGDWQAASAWNEAGSPSCNTTSKILIDGDTITANCAIDVSGGGSITVRNEGYLKIKGGLEVSGQAEVTVEDDAGMRVEGDLTISGQGSFTTNGETDVTQDLVKNGNKSSADGSGTLNLGGTGCSNFSGTGDCNGNAPLPVKLLEFKAEAKREKVRVSWVTASEDRNDHFLLQRSSRGVDYQTIKRIEGQGTSVQRHSYEHLDTDPLQGGQYYRLIQVDRNGKRTEYGPRRAEVKAKDRRKDCEMKVVPNPCSGNCKVRFKGDCEKRMEDGELQVRLYDIAGNRIQTNMERSGGFSSELFIDTDENLSPGVYVVRAVSNKGAVASEKMKKE